MRLDVQADLREVALRAAPRRSRRGRGSGTSPARGRACAWRRCLVDGLRLLAAAGGGHEHRRRGPAPPNKCRRAVVTDAPAAPAPRARRGARSSAMSPNRAIAIRERISTAAKTLAVSSCAVPTWIACPSPASDPTSSPNTAPITATATATLAPENRNGSEEGSSSRRSRSKREAPSVRIILTWSRVDALEPVERVDDDREEADQGDHDQLRGDAEAEPDHEDRSDHDHRHGLRGDHERVDGAPQDGGEVQQRSRSRRRPRARARSRAAPRGPSPRRPERAGHGRRQSARATSLGRRQQVVLDVAELARAAPSRPPGAPASAAGAGPFHASASSARSFSAANSGEVTCSRRGRERSSSTRSSARTVPGRGERISTRSQRKSASSTSWVTSSVVRGSSASAAGEPLLQLGARDRVERPERLVQEQDRLPREQGAGERDSLAHAAGELVRLGSRRTPRARSARRAGAPGGGPLRARTPSQLECQRGVVERAPPGQQQVPLRHQDAAAKPLGRRTRRPRRPSHRRLAPAGRRRAPAASTCRTRTARRARAARPRAPRASAPAARSPRRPCGGRPWRRRDASTAGRPAWASLPLGSLGRDWLCSLRGHYPTGSKGQRRGREALSQPASREPPCLHLVRRV